MFGIMFAATKLHSHDKMHPMRNRYIYITLLSLLGFSAEATAQAFIQASNNSQALAQTPKLVVTISVHQLRTDHLETYAPLYGEDGLKRLLTAGTVYTNGSYPFTPVDAAAAAATLATGTTPYYHGISSREWFDRTTLRTVKVVRDAKYGYSSAQLATSTLGDELKIATEGVAKVFSFAADAESAILSAGHAADGAAWVEQGKWQTTSYYAPVNQWLSGYTRLYPPMADVNSSLTKMALHCVEQAGYGLDEKTDLLSVSYSVTPTMESYVALDQNVAELISGITRRIPLDRVLFVLTSTGSPKEEEDNDNERYRIPTGKFSISRTAGLLNMYLGATYGSEQYVEAIYSNQLFLNHKLLERKNINMSELLRRSQEFILQLSGVRNVYTASQLLTSDSYLLERIRGGFNVEKCGDLLIDIAPGWQLVNEDTQTSVTSRASNIPFPIIFYGASTSSQRIETPVTVDHIAPTIARAIRIRAPNACSAEPLF